MKPGWKTTEFWLHGFVSLCSMAVSAASLTMLHDQPIVQMAGAVGGAILAFLSSHKYSDGRTQVKVEALRADIKPKPLDPALIP